MWLAKSSREFAASTLFAPLDVLFAITFASKNFKGRKLYIKYDPSANLLLANISITPFIGLENQWFKQPKKNSFIDFNSIVNWDITAMSRIRLLVSGFQKVIGE